MDTLEEHPMVRKFIFFYQATDKITRQMTCSNFFGTGLEVSVLSGVGLSVPPKRRCVCQLNSASCRVQSLLTSDIPVAVDDELLLQSTHMSSL
ncbi:hypothetical protein Tco_1566991 [Tanacetum coccineum]